MKQRQIIFRFLFPARQDAAKAIHPAMRPLYQGPSVVRWLLVESAWRAIAKSPSLRAFYERVRHGQPQRKKIAIVATARKMLSIMRAMQISGEAFNEKLVLEQEPTTFGKKLVV